MPSMDLFKRREKSGERPSDDDSEQLSRAVGVTRRSIFGKIGSILGQDQITTATWEELEEVLIENHFLGLASDQNAGPYGIEIPFFNSVGCVMVVIFGGAAKLIILAGRYVSSNLR